MANRRELLEALFGPMFACEWRVACRRGHVFLLRSVFVVILLAGLWIAWMSAVNRAVPQSPIRLLADLGAAIFAAFTVVQLALVMLVAPGVTAGAVCQDRARGTLLHLMVTDLTDREIVLGKLGARLMGMLGLILAALPVIALMTLLGGIDPKQLLGVFAVTIGLAVLGCSLALLLSVRAHKAHEVVMVVYLIWLGWILAWPILGLLYESFTGPLGWSMPWLGPDGWLARSNPVWILFGPMGVTSTIGLVDQLVFAAGTLAVSGLFTALAVWRLRPSAIRVETRPLFSWSRLRLNLRPFLPGPPLDWNPVLWREWHRNRPSLWSRIIWWTYGLCSGLLTAWVIFYAPYGMRDLGAVATVLIVGVGLLLLSVSAATTLAEERVRGSLDILMTTPLPTRRIVLGKWLGGYRGAPWLAVIPGIIALTIAFRTGQWYGAFLVVGSILIEGALIVSLGLWFATLTSRVGRAIGFSVGVYVFFSIGWMFLLVLFFPSGPRGPANFLGALSPLFNMGLLTDMLNNRGFFVYEREVLGAGSFWAVVKLIAAGLIYAITLSGFEKRLGRITMTRDPRSPLLGFPPGKPMKDVPVPASEAFL